MCSLYPSALRVASLQPHALQPSLRLRALSLSLPGLSLSPPAPSSSQSLAEGASRERREGVAFEYPLAVLFHFAISENIRHVQIPAEFAAPSQLSHSCKW